MEIGSWGVKMLKCSDMKEVIVDSMEELEKQASVFVDTITPREHAYVIALSGNLGAGKTTFVKQIAPLLGIEEHMTSPTFVIQKNYDIAWQGFEQFIHIDAYRIEHADEMKALKFQETLLNKRNLICIEWAENIKDILPEDRETIMFETIDENTRRLIFYGTEN